MALEIAHLMMMNPQIPADQNEDFLTAAEVAKRYKVTSRTVLNWVERKQVPATRIGKVVRFQLSDLKKAIEGGTKPGGE